MPASRWIPFYTAFLRAHWGKLTVVELTVLLNHSHSPIYTKAKSLGLGRQVGFTWGVAQKELLHQLYSTHANFEIANIFQQRWPQHQWTEMMIITAMRRYNIKRSRQMLKSISIRVEAEGKQKAKRGRRIPHPIGTMKWSEGVKFYMYKSPVGWVRYSRYRYEQLHGKLPGNMVVIHADGDARNIADDNLIAISREDSAKKSADKGVLGLSDNYLASYLRRTYKVQESQEDLLKNKDLLRLAKTKILVQRKLK